MKQAVIYFLVTFLAALPQAAWALDISGAARVQDGDTIEIEGRKIRLQGIDAFETGQRCRDSRGGTQACGKFATIQLATLIGTATVQCRGDSFDDYDRLIARCEVAGSDLGAAMVRAGMAMAFARYSDTYVLEEAAARAARAGFLLDGVQPPWEYRAQRWRVAAQQSPEGCPIKGNISANGRIYHVPYSEFYDRTRISPDRGERWFCSEREALDAGWRAPLN